MTWAVLRSFTSPVSLNSSATQTWSSPCDIAGITSLHGCVTRQHQTADLSGFAGSSHAETMMSPCAPAAAVSTNKSPAVRVGGWDALIALLILEFCTRTAPDKHIRETGERAYGPAEPRRSPLSPLKSGKLSFREVTGLLNTHHWL